MITLNNLQSPKGANRNTKRLGRGQGSGQGTQAGKGHKGQKARKSGHVRTGFEGNNLPLYMRLPKRGFNNSVFAKNVFSVSLKSIEDKFEVGEVVNAESLIAKGLIKGSSKAAAVKIIGNTAIKKLVYEGKLTFSEAAGSVLKNLGCEIR